MASVTNYSSLRQFITDYVGAITIITPHLDGFIQRAEKKISKTLRVDDMETHIGPVAEVIGKEGQGIFQLPDDFEAIASVSINGRDVPDANSHRARIQRYGTVGTGGAARLYTVSGKELHISPVPGSEPDVVYYASIPPLSGDAGKETNWLIDKYPDLYEDACLAEAFRFRRNMAMAQDYGQSADSTISRMNINAAAQLAIGGSVPAGANP